MTEGGIIYATVKIKCCKDAGCEKISEKLEMGIALHSAMAAWILYSSGLSAGNVAVLLFYGFFYSVGRQMDWCG